MGAGYKPTDVKKTGVLASHYAQGSGISMVDVRGLALLCGRAAFVAAPVRRIPHALHLPLFSIVCTPRISRCV